MDEEGKTKNEGRTRKRGLGVGRNPHRCRDIMRVSLQRNRKKGIYLGLVAVGNQ